MAGGEQAGPVMKPDAQRQGLSDDNGGVRDPGGTRSQLRLKKGKKRGRDIFDGRADGLFHAVRGC